MSPNRPVAVKPPYSNARVKTTIRIDRQIWEEFKTSTEAKDLSTCHVLEALISAWLYGGSLVPGLAQPVQLNLTMQHVVARPRRMGPELEVSDKEWADWVKYYEDTWLFTPVKIGPRRYRLDPV